MAETLSGLGRLTELRQRLLFVFAALIIYRIGTFIPVPGVNPQALLQFMNSQQGTIVDGPKPQTFEKTFILISHIFLYFIQPQNSRCWLMSVIIISGMS